LFNVDVNHKQLITGKAMIDMRDQEIRGKKIFYREAELGKVVEIKNAFSAKKVAIIEVENNSFKAVPLEFINPVADRLQFSSDRSIIDAFPKLGSRDVENDPEKLKQAIREHYGEPQSWQNSKSDFDSKKEEAYMGSSQITDQEPSGTFSKKVDKSLNEEMDYDKINRGKDGNK
jgi:hypothetical protein